MAWVWEEDTARGSEGFWYWDIADGPQEPDARSRKEQGTPGERVGEKISNDGLDRRLREGTGPILHPRSVRPPT